MPKGNKGIKRPNYHPTEENINALKENNIKRGLEKRKIWEQIAIDNNLRCRKCKLEKSLDLFNLRKHPHYKMWATQCRICENIDKDNMAKDRANIKGLEWNIKKIFCGIKYRIEKSGKELDLDIPFLVELYNKQSGICHYSGRKMVFNINSQERLSLDRKDSLYGYTKENVVWCCWQVNNIKQDLSIEDFKFWISSIHNRMNEISL